MRIVLGALGILCAMQSAQAYEVWFRVCSEVETWIYLVLH